jgi:shikimate kinase
MHLALTGFMGAGKTTVGRRLARLLRMPFADSDAEIARAHGEIKQIFEVEGEVQFRRYEREALESLVSGPPSVMAVGGGAVVSPENRALLRRSGVIVHLAIDAEAAHKRVAHRTHRPLLGETPDVNAIRALLERRREAYADNDFEVRAGGRTPEALAREIARWYRERTAEAAR